MVYFAATRDSAVLFLNAATGVLGEVATIVAPITVSVNPVSNKIYVASLPTVNMAMIDGITNISTTLIKGNGSAELSENPAIAVNPMTNKIFADNSHAADVTVLTEQQVQTSSLTTRITPLSGNQTNSPTPAFTFTTASATLAPPTALFFQVDTWQNAWTKASGRNPTFTGTLARLNPGFHILYAWATDGEEATATQGSPLIGAIQAYGFLVTP